MVYRLAPDYRLACCACGAEQRRCETFTGQRDICAQVQQHLIRNLERTLRLDPSCTQVPDRRRARRAALSCLEITEALLEERDDKGIAIALGAVSVICASTRLAASSIT